MEVLPPYGKHIVELRNRLNFVTGILNVSMACVLFIFLLVKLCRKSKLPYFNWIALLVLNITLLSVGLIQTIIFCHDGKRKDAYKEYVIQDFENIVLFNLSAILGFNALLIGTNMVKFATKGTLPCAKYVKRFNLIVYGIWVMITTIPIVNFINCLYWIFRNKPG